MFIAQTRVCGNPWDTTIYNIVHLEECWMRKIEKTFLVCTSRPRATTCALSFVKQLCKKNLVTFFFLYFFYPILHRRRYSLADKTKSKRLYRLGKNKSFIRTLVGTLSRCPAVSKEHFGAFRVIILCQRNPFTFYCLNHSRLLRYF